MQRFLTLALPFLALLLFAAAPAARAEHLTLPPFDEAGQDPGFRAYRAELIAAVERRDTAAVVAMAAPDIMLSFGDDGGREVFAAWLDAKESAAYWQSLERVLGEGGKFDGPLFIAPWAYWVELPPELDVYGAAVVAGTNVRLRQGPTTDAPIIRALTYEVVVSPPYDPERTDSAVDDSGRAWTRVATTHGETGWMATAYLRFLLDYRAGFEKRPDGWQMIFFIAGD